MTARIRIAIFGIFALLTAIPVHAAQPASFADLVETLMPAVVNIATTTKIDGQRPRIPHMPDLPPGSPFEEFFEEFLDNAPRAMPHETSSLGSGFIIDAEKGYVVTNNHVIAEADEIHVVLSDDTMLDAKIVGRDLKTDIAVLKIESDHKLTAVTFGDSKLMRVGDWVLAIGNPFGLGGTVTAGIISASARDINAGPYDDFIQTDAAINRGNSGGPMFNLNGEVIGINTAIFSPSGGSVGIGFTIPADLAKPVISQLIEYGRTRRGWLGVRIQRITDEIAETLGLDATEGALVASLTKDGPAEKAGLKSGDVILEFDGQKIDAMRELPRIVANTSIGKKAIVKLWRKGEIITRTATIGELEEAEKNGLTDGGETDAPLEMLGMTLMPIDENMIENAQGVRVSKVEPFSPAADKGFRAGDLILEVDQESVSTPDDFARQIDAARKAGQKSVLILFERKGDRRFQTLSLEEEKSDE